MATHLFLPGESHGQRSLVGYSPRVAKSRKGLEWLTTLPAEPLSLMAPYRILWDVAGVCSPRMQSDVLPEAVREE